MMIIAENFGRGIQGGGDSGFGDFSDAERRVGWWRR